MGTYNAFYIRKQATDEVTRSAILSLYPGARVVSTADFMGGVLSSKDIEAPEAKLSALSAELATDIIWVTSQTTAESFVYHHWRAGSHLRALHYGCANEGTWDRVEGHADAWEKEAFWSKEDLECQLESAETESERRKLRKLWADGLLIKGEIAPSAGSDTAVEAVMVHYGLIADDKLTETQPQRREWMVTNKERLGCLLFLAVIIGISYLVVLGIRNLFS
jgi:hypothetical protein